MRSVPRPSSLISSGSLVAVASVLSYLSPPPLAAQELEKCEGPVGTLAVVEPQDEILEALALYDLQTPTPVLRTMAGGSRARMSGPGDARP